jgi:hypothetical protein
MRDTTKWLVAAAAAVGAVVVAGLQLSKIPTGDAATVLSIGGFAVALAGVSLILFSAAGVLSAGYTTLGELSDLKDSNDLRLQREQQLYWGAKIKPWDKRVERYKKIPPKPDTRRKRRSPGVVLKSISARAVVGVLEFIKRRRVRHAESEGIRIDEMLHYLNTDVFYFSNGIAENMAELWERLEETDREILVLKGEQAPDGNQGPAPDVGPDPRPGCVGMLFRRLRWRVAPRPKPADSLENSEWRQARLEIAAGQLIAFANQKLMEHQFSRLKTAVRIGGLAVGAGVASFVLAPKLSTEIPLPVTQPTPVSVQVTSDKFGPDCPRGTLLQGVAVGGTWEKPIVVTEAQGTCGARQVTLNSGQAIAVPQVSRSPSPSPSPTPTPS